MDTDMARVKMSTVATFPLFTHKNDDFGTISVTELNFAIRCNHSVACDYYNDLIITQVFVSPGLMA